MTRTRHIMRILAGASLFSLGLLPGTPKVVPVIGTKVDVDLYGNIYVINSDLNTLTLFSKEGTLVRRIGGSGWLNDQFDRPAGVWARNGIDLFIADYGNHRIQRFDRNLNYVSTFYTRDSDNPDERFGYPFDVALSRMGDLYICDGENLRILKVNGLNLVEKEFGGFGGGKGRLQKPTGVEIGPRDFLYILDGGRVVVFDSFGNYVRELCEGLFRNPASVFADDNSIAVLDDDTLYCFDRNERPAGVFSVAALLSPPVAHVQSLVFGNGLLYILTGSELRIIADPRLGETHP
jgi:DNA-binding beta-propeller fold protein YncE